MNKEYDFKNMKSRKNPYVEFIDFEKEMLKRISEAYNIPKELLSKNE